MANPTLLEISRALGRIEGKIDVIEQNQNEFSQRLVSVEKRAIKNSTICGAVVSVAFGLLSETLKNKLGL